MQQINTIEHFPDSIESGNFRVPVVVNGQRARHVLFGHAADPGGFCLDEGFGFLASSCPRASSDQRASSEILFDICSACAQRGANFAWILET